MDSLADAPDQLDVGVESVLLVGQAPFARPKPHLLGHFGKGIERDVFTHRHAAGAGGLAVNPG